MVLNCLCVHISCSHMLYTQVILMIFSNGQPVLVRDDPIFRITAGERCDSFATTTANQSVFA